MKKPARYEPNGLALPTPGEFKNGFTALSLTAYLKNACDTEYEFRSELYNRAKHRERLAHAALARFERDEDLTVAENQARRDVLAREAAEAEADAVFAADKYMAAVA